MRLDDAIEAAAIAEHPDYPVHDLDDMKIQNHRENMRKAFRAGCAFLRSPEGLRLLCEAEIERLEAEREALHKVARNRGVTHKSGSVVTQEDDERLLRQMETTAYAWQQILESLK
jgi:hypothetical protein